LRLPTPIRPGTTCPSHASLLGEEVYGCPEPLRERIQPAQDDRLIPVVTHQRILPCGRFAKRPDFLAGPPRAYRDLRLYSGAAGEGRNSPRHATRGSGWGNFRALTFSQPPSTRRRDLEHTCRNRGWSSLNALPPSRGILSRLSDAGETANTRGTNRSSKVLWGRS